jgi:hypothetical protein
VTSGVITVATATAVTKATKNVSMTTP